MSAASPDSPAPGREALLGFLRNLANALEHEADRGPIARALVQSLTEPLAALAAEADVHSAEPIAVARDWLALLRNGLPEEGTTRTAVEGLEYEVLRAARQYGLANAGFFKNAQGLLQRISAYDCEDAKETAAKEMQRHAALLPVAALGDLSGDLS